MSVFRKVTHVRIAAFRDSDRALLTKLGLAVGGIYSTVITINERLTQLMTAQADLQASVDALNAVHTHILTVISNFENTVNALIAEIAKLQAGGVDTAAVEAQVANINSIVGDLNAAISAVENPPSTPAEASPSATPPSGTPTA